MRIIRYSFDGFKPQYQSYHLKNVIFHLKHFSLYGLPEHLHSVINEEHRILKPFYEESYSDFQYGIWAFIDGFKCNQSLNHLKRKVPCWKAEISDDVIVYDVNWEKKLKITDDKCKFFGFYVPEKELHTLRILH